MFKKLFTTLFLLIGFTQFTPTYACSGGRPSTLKELIQDADTVVKGVMETVDAAGQNGILNVESILAGNVVPQRILLALYPSERIHSTQERSNSGGCFTGVQPLLKGETIIIFLKKMPNGAYELAPRSYLNPTYYAFPKGDSRVHVFDDENGEPFVISENYPQPSPTRVLDVLAFAQLITKLAGNKPIQPNMTSPSPLPTSLYIRTEAGNEYALPVDLSTPNLITTKLAYESGNINHTGCTTINCVGTSSNGVDSAQVMPDGTVHILSGYGANAPGSAFQFSTTNDAFAVWTSDTLTVYALPYDRLGFCCFELTLINSISLTNVIKNVTHVAWSPDGRLVAYNDSIGLYLWDVFTAGSRPRLLAAPLYQTVTPRFFSTTGRYVAIQRGDQRFYLDMVSGAEIPDGIISPDDRTQLQFDTQRSSPLQLYRLAPYLRKELITDYTNVRQAQWIDRSFYLVAGCADQQTNECHVWQDGLLSGGSAQYEGFAFAYDRVTTVLALAMSGKRIGIVDRVRTLHTYDFSASLDSEIQAIEWMPPIFFQPNL